MRQGKTENEGDTNQDGNSINTLLSINSQVHFASNYSDLQTAINNANPGDTVLVDTDFSISSALSISKSLALQRLGNSTITNTASNPFMQITADNIVLRDLWLTGVGTFGNMDWSTAYTNAIDAIVIGDNTNKYENILLDNIKASNIGDSTVAAWGNNTTPLENITVRDCDLSGTAQADKDQQGIRIKSCDGVEVSNCEIYDFGINIIPIGNTKNGKFVGNKVHDASTQHGFYLSGSSTKMKLANNDIYNNAACGIKSSAGHTQIIENRLDGNGSWTINQKGNVSNIIIANNIMLNGGDSGIEIDSESAGETIEDLKIMGNTISGMTDAAIALWLDNDNDIIKDVLIEGNTLLNCSDYGIRVRGNTATGASGENVQISNNTITDMYYSAIRIGSDWNQIAIKDNVLRDNFTSESGDNSQGHIRIYGSTRVSIENNSFVTDDISTPAGIYIDNGANTTLVLYNDIRGHTDALTDGGSNAITDPVNQDKTNDYNLT